MTVHRRRLGRSRNARGIFGRIDRIVGAVVELAAALLVVIEIVLLSAGVFWRYVLDSPLVWADELAGILFLWLVSLGAAIALRRSEHMRMTFFVGAAAARSCSASSRALSALIVVLFTLVVIVPGISYMAQQQAITTPTLQIPGSWEIAGELVGFALLLFTAVRQFLDGITLAGGGGPRRDRRRRRARAVAARRLVPGYRQCGPA